MLTVVMLDDTNNPFVLSGIMLSIIMLSGIMLNVIMMNVIMLNIIMLNVIMLTILLPAQIVDEHDLKGHVKFTDFVDR